MNIVHVPTFDYIVDTLGNQLKPTTVTFANGATEIQWNSAHHMHHHIVNIGAWNMDADPLKTVAHTQPADFNHDNIIGITAVIFNDARTSADFVIVGDTVAADLSTIFYATTVGHDINLRRQTGGIFDNTAHDDAVMNRGYIDICYFST